MRADERLLEKAPRNPSLKPQDDSRRAARLMSCEGKCCVVVVVVVVVVGADDGARCAVPLPTKKTSREGPTSKSHKSHSHLSTSLKTTHFLFYFFVSTTSSADDDDDVVWVGSRRHIEDSTWVCLETLNTQRDSSKMRS